MTTKISPAPVWILLMMFSVSHTTEPLCTAALPMIASHLSITENLVQLSSSIYFSGFATGVLTLGVISDIFGRRKVALWGFLLYFISSIACSFVDNIYVLFALRFIQAFGVSVGSVVAQSMARDSYQGSALSQVYISIAICMSFIPSVGSILGGYIVEYAGWRYNFRFLGVTSGILLLLSLRFLPETNMYIGNATNYRYIDVFKTIMSDKVVLLYAVIVGAFNGMMFGFYLEAPFIFIQHYHFSPSAYGKLGMLLTVAYLVGALINRYMVSLQMSNTKIIIIGLLLSVVSCATLLIGGIYTKYANITSHIVVIAVIFIPTMLHVIGHNLVIPLILRFALENYAKVTGTAGSIFGALYYFFVALINYTVSHLHSASGVPFMSLFFGLSVTCLISFLIVMVVDSRSRPLDFA